VGLEPDCVPKSYLLQQAQQLRQGKGGIPTEELGDVPAPVARDHGRQHTSPELGTARRDLVLPREGRHQVLAVVAEEAAVESGPAGPRAALAPPVQVADALHGLFDRAAGGSGGSRSSPASTARQRSEWRWRPARWPTG